MRGGRFLDRGITGLVVGEGEGRRGRRRGRRRKRDLFVSWNSLGSITEDGGGRKGRVEKEKGVRGR